MKLLETGARDAHAGVGGARAQARRVQYVPGVLVPPVGLGADGGGERRARTLIEPRVRRFNGTRPHFFAVPRRRATALRIQRKLNAAHAIGDLDIH